MDIWPIYIYMLYGPYMAHIWPIYGIYYDQNHLEAASNVTDFPQAHHASMAERLNYIEQLVRKSDLFGLRWQYCGHLVESFFILFHVLTYSDLLKHFQSILDRFDSFIIYIIYNIINIVYISYCFDIPFLPFSAQGW